jgi:phage head maturation protease
MEKNIVVTGDQSRLLLTILTNKNVTYSGDTLISMLQVVQQLLEVSNVQPPAPPLENPA